MRPPAPRASRPECLTSSLRVRATLQALAAASARNQPGRRAPPAAMRACALARPPPRVALERAEHLEATLKTGPERLPATARQAAAGRPASSLPAGFQLRARSRQWCKSWRRRATIVTRDVRVLASNRGRLSENRGHTPEARLRRWRAASRLAPGTCPPGAEKQTASAVRSGPLACVTYERGAGRAPDAVTDTIDLPPRPRKARRPAP